MSLTLTQNRVDSTVEKRMFASSRPRASARSRAGKQGSSPMTAGGEDLLVPVPPPPSPPPPPPPILSPQEDLSFSSRTYPLQATKFSQNMTVAKISMHPQERGHILQRTFEHLSTLVSGFISFSNRFTSRESGAALKKATSPLMMCT